MTRENGTLLRNQLEKGLDANATLARLPRGLQDNPIEVTAVLPIR